MISFLICYGTGEGQTEKVAERIIKVIRERSHEATAVNTDEIPSDLDVKQFDAVLVGASIHAGKHQSVVREFVKTNRDALAKKPTAFFQVSLSSATEEGRTQAAGYVEEFIEDTGWHPDRIGLFGGALRYSEYGFLKRLMMKQIAKRTMPDVDTSRDAEFTDWDEVEAFAADVAAFVEGRLGIDPSDSNGQEEVE
ncbi:protoporphyrinogen oxidase (plasmid) [Halorussus limi]|uniref:Protoporphyrinogen oxidase n=1 Tax=Halorussus limi TaxID=2938695 RepID=A0A8U0I1V7_9EURY|nr:flavodoxin domain-containing protein [Halorussus limi]UPV76684.1 protoporphyrinogen oxidase [Halorussus limi]